MSTIISRLNLVDSMFLCMQSGAGKYEGITIVSCSSDKYVLIFHTFSVMFHGKLKFLLFFLIHSCHEQCYFAKFG